MEEKISSEELQKNIPKTDEVSDPDAVSESTVTTVSGNHLLSDIDSVIADVTEAVIGGGTGSATPVPYTISANPSEDLFPVYDTYEAFMESPVYVTRYENELLSRLEFIQYALAIMIALLFLLIFKKK